MILQRTVDTYAGMYDFAVSGGLQGSYNLQVPIPNNTAIVEFAAWALTAPTSATNAATISFDTIQTNVNPFITAVGGLKAAALVTAYPTFPGASTIDFTGSSFPGPTSTRTFFVNYNFSIGMTIAIEDLLTGRIVFYLRAISYDLGVV